MKAVHSLADLVYDKLAPSMKAITNPRYRGLVDCELQIFQQTLHLYGKINNDVIPKRHSSIWITSYKEQSVRQPWELSRMTRQANSVQNVNIYIYINLLLTIE